MMGADLPRLAPTFWHSIYDPHRFTGLVWKHPATGGCCLKFPNGKLSVTGRAESLESTEPGLVATHDEYNGIDLWFE